MVWHNSDGSLKQENVFWRGADDNALWTMSSTDGINFSAPSSLGGVLTSGPGCAGFADSQVLCAVIGTDGHIWTRLGLASSGWLSWQDMGTPY